MTKSYASADRPLNSYNLFFILERMLFLQSNGIDSTVAKSSKMTVVEQRTTPSSSSSSKTVNFEDYCDLTSIFPPMPSKYQAIHLPVDWFMHGKSKKKTRDHSRSHGIIAFKDMAKMIANNWKNVDKEVSQFVTEVARVIKERRDEYIMAKLLRSYQPDADDCVVDDKEFPTAMLCQVIQKQDDLMSMTSLGSTVRAFFVQEVDTPNDEIIAMWRG